jgi:sirohydrochlorin cobaltochelatase
LAGWCCDDDGEAVQHEKKQLPARCGPVRPRLQRSLWRKPGNGSGACAAGRQRDDACAYLELTEPDLQSVVQTLVNEGASSIRVVPMFLGVGRHAREDLPLLMTELRALYPKVVFELQQSIGEDQRLIDLIADIAMSP